MSYQEITTPLYWDCDCDVDYIHSKDESKCRRCGANHAQYPEDYADSHRAEVRKYFGADVLLDVVEVDVQARPEEIIFFVSGPESTDPGTPLIPQWCTEEHNDANSFLCYPADGECLCGVHEHHVHCGHGQLVKVG